MININRDITTKNMSISLPQKSKKKKPIENLLKSTCVNFSLLLKDQHKFVNRHLIQQTFIALIEDYFLHLRPMIKTV